MKSYFRIDLLDYMDNMMELGLRGLTVFLANALALVFYSALIFYLFDYQISTIMADEVFRPVAIAVFYGELSLLAVSICLIVISSVISIFRLKSTDWICEIMRIKK